MRSLPLLAFSAGAVVLLAQHLNASRPNPEAARYRDAFRRPARVSFPSANPYSKEKYLLGKALFNDPRLSGSGEMSCASCHDSSRAWTDGAVLSSMKLKRRVPTLFNVAWGWSFFWDGRAATLEEQALGPIQNPDEMNLPLTQLNARVGGVPEYRDAFARAFPGEPIGPAQIARAIATYERTIVAPVTPFDRWVAGEETAISDSAKRGFVVFNNGGACVKCHTGWAFTNGVFADIGLATEDIGRGGVVTNRYLRYAFKTPSLREIGHRRGYMHDGSLATLSDVIENYDVGGKLQRETTRLFIKPLHLSTAEKEDLLSFLATLDSEETFSVSLARVVHRKVKQQ